MVINNQGTFVDFGVWMYQRADGKNTLAPGVKGTNETIVMPSPAPPPGGKLVGITRVRHNFVTLGYPMQISLVDKLFAAAYQIPIYTSLDGALWEYPYGAGITDEKPLGGQDRPPFNFLGPFPADGPLPDTVHDAFAFAVKVMNSITNMPASQKDLKNYGVLFVDDGATIWVEFGPRFAPGEAPHLGCQTQLGRDMVVGYEKDRTSVAPGQVGRFLQCF